MIDWQAVLQGAGWASFGSVVVALVTLWVKDRWERGKLSVEREKIAVAAREVAVSAAEVVVHDRTAEAALQEMATRTYQGLIAALKERVDELEERLGVVELREHECRERVTQLEEEQGRLQARLWQGRHPGDG